MSNLYNYRFSSVTLILLGLLFISGKSICMDNENDAQPHYKIIHYPINTPLKHSTHSIFGGKIEEFNSQNGDLVDEYLDGNANCPLASDSFNNIIKEAFDNGRLPIIAATDVFDKNTQKYKRTYFDGSYLYRYLYTENSFQRLTDKLHPTFKEEIKNITFFTACGPEGDLVYLGDEKALQEETKESFLIKLHIIAGIDTDGASLFDYGAYLYNNKFYEQAKKILKFAADKFNHAGSINRLATLYTKQNKLDLAEKYYLLAIELNNPNAAHNLGFLYEQQNKLDLAEKYYLLGIEIDSNNPQAANNLGRFYKQQNKLDLAEKYYLLAIELNNPNAFNNLGFLYKQQNKLDLAEKYYLLAIEKDSNNPQAAHNLGYLYYEQNKLDLAEKYYLIAIELNNPKAANNLGFLYEHQNKLDLAEKYYLIAIERNNPQAAHNLGFLYEHQNKLDLAEKYYLQAYENNKYPDNLTTARNLGNLYFKQNKFDLAEKYYVILLANDAQHPSIPYNLGFIYFQQNKLDQAEQYYRKAWEIYRDIDAAYELVSVYQKQNKFELADKYYMLAKSKTHVY